MIIPQTYPLWLRTNAGNHVLVVGWKIDETGNFDAQPVTAEPSVFATVEPEHIPDGPPRVRFFNP